MLPDKQDAYGHMIADHFNGKTGYEIVERDDGFIDVSTMGPAHYFAEFKGCASGEVRFNTMCFLRPHLSLVLGLAWGNYVHCNSWFFDITFNS